MNGKQAKRLRRAALGLATTLSEAGKDIKKDGYQEIRTTGSLSSIQDGSPYSVQLKVRPDSLKGIYKQLKSGKV